MTYDDPPQSDPKLLLATAKIALRVASLAELIERHLGPKSRLFADPDPFITAREAGKIQAEMTDLAGELLGVTGE